MDGDPLSERALLGCHPLSVRPRRVSEIGLVNAEESREPCEDRSAFRGPLPSSEPGKLKFA